MIAPQVPDHPDMVRISQCQFDDLEGPNLVASHGLGHVRLGSMLAGRATEIGSINGAVVRTAAQAGIATPVTSTLADIIRLMEAQRPR